MRALITLKIMKLLKAEIKNWEESRGNKFIAWTTCTIAFSGCLRIHEILCKSKHEFEPDLTLLGKDIMLKKTSEQRKTTKIIQILIKSLKED